MTTRMHEPFAVDLAVSTHTGTRRRGSTDHCGKLIQSATSGLIAVADGMTATEGGELASERAVSTLIRSFRDLSRGLPQTERLVRAVRNANYEIREMALTVPQLSRMSTTLTAVTISGGLLSAAHVGNGRVYLLRDGSIVAVGYLLSLFYLVDRPACTKETLADLANDERLATPLSVEGRLNILWLCMVVLAVFLPSPIREVVMLAAATLSLVLGSQAGRKRNAFTFAPIVEVAILFAGIFVTMPPTLVLLEAKGPSLGLVAPWHFFFVTGALSSVLDNAPTYLSFLTTAQSTALAMQLPVSVVAVPASFLVAVSVGAVFMGANTYIGNGPNFMVKSMAEASGYRMPSFGRYTVLALAVLSPLYLATAFLVGLY